MSEHDDGGESDAEAGTVRDAGYDDWLDAVAAGEGYYLACPEGHGSVPPRHVCPVCGDRDLAEEPLPDEGEVLAHTVVRVASPQFAEDAPYATAVAAFGPVRLTGMVRADPETVENGLAVAATVGETATTGDRTLVFEPE